MSLKTRKRTIYVKAESTYGTDPVPASVDAIYVGNLSVNPFQADAVERVADRSSFGNKRQLHVGARSTITFDVELVGSGTLGTAPAWGKLALACGMAETVVVSTSVAYNLDSDATDSVTIYFNEDGNLYAMTGCRGSWQIVLNDLQVPVLRFTFFGIYNTPTAVALGAAAGEANFQFPKPVTSANTTMTIHGQAVTLRSCTIDGGQQVQYFDDEGVVEITDRRVGGNAAFLMQAVGTKNWFDAIANDTLGAFVINHHQDNAYRVIVDTGGANTCQLVGPSKSDDRGRSVISAGLVFEPTSANDDELEIRLAAA